MTTLDSLLSKSTERTGIHETLTFYQQAMNWLIEHGPNIISGFIILFIGLWFIKLFSGWLHRRMHRHEMDPSLKPFLLSLSIIALRILLVLGVMQIFGIQMTIFAALVGAFGVAAGLALSGTLQNFASGVLILFLKPFTVGDNIVTQGIEGTVSSIEIFYTIVTTFDNRTVVVPNSKLSNEVIINITKVGSRRLDIELKFNYATDVQKVKEVVTRVVEDSKDILKSPKYRLGVAAFDAEWFIIGLNVWVKAHGFQDMKLLFQEKLLEELSAAGIKVGK